MLCAETAAATTKAIAIGLNAADRAKAPELESGDSAGDIETDSGGLAMDGGE